ncbi:quinol monooxygenase YgiN [Jatrophihabitans sp. GAS493]|uniref:putative quinol monooxygenase n=1 Tax=Jatrophihabitans sp. GAS493 TaxID=1907575 RepID=UPI000BB8B704|nr:putative quinol monooxygenase [Jatrophihabitans sp. GAS493]SOD75161.1 quinol monooxygenase YgiN [Jatrophihabitans sp. GAS493]
MPEVNVVAVIKARDGKGDELAAALSGLATATHGEDGCIHYSLHRGLEDTDTFVTVEKWGSSEDLKGHMASPHMKAAMSQFGDLLAGAPTVIPLGAIDLGSAEKGIF